MMKRNTKIFSLSFSLSPDVEQEMMVRDNHTFYYNNRNTVVA